MSSKEDNPKYQAGVEMRRKLFGEAGIERMKDTDDFHEPLEEFATSAVFGGPWSRPGLTMRERSLITLAVVAALNRPLPVKRLTKIAIECGATKEEIRETLLQTTAYMGVAGGVEAWEWVTEALKEAGAY